MNYQLKTKNYKQFTLIELLVVMVILTLTIGITGPFAVEMVERNARKAEELKLIQAVKRLGDIAYTKNEELEVTLKGRSFKVESTDGETSYEVTFKDISFEEQQFSISRTGYADRSSITTLRGQVIRLNDGASQ